MAFAELSRASKIRFMKYLWANQNIPDEFYYFEYRTPRKNELSAWDTCLPVPVNIYTQLTTSSVNPDEVMVAINQDTISLSIPRYSSINAASKQLNILMSII